MIENMRKNYKQKKSELWTNSVEFESCKHLPDRKG